MENKCILLVEDNKKLACYLKDCLEDAGFSVAIEHQGDKAAFKIIKEQPLAVVLDIMLPGMSGRQICHTVRREYNGKILMLTAIDELQSEIDSLNLGADDYLTKPVEEALLIARLKALLRRPTTLTSQDELNFGELSLRLSEQSMRLKGKKVLVTDSEFELLALLAKNHDSILSRDNICYVLYGREYDGVDRGIDSKISRLRKALGDDKGERIKTMRGKGYMFLSKGWS